jgi:hypothetical protein
MWEEQAIVLTWVVQVVVFVTHVVNLAISRGIAIKGLLVVKICRQRKWIELKVLVE